MIRHVKGVHGSKAKKPAEVHPHPCEQCGSRFVNRYHLNEHMRNVHNSHEHRRHPAHKCPVQGCEKSFTTANWCNHHIRDAHDATPAHEYDRVLRTFNFSRDVGFQCPTCSRYFVGLRERDNHIDTMHRCVRLHKCQYCSKAFRIKQNRAYHERTCSSEAARAHRPTVQTGFGNQDLEEDETEFTRVQSANDGANIVLRLLFSEDTKLLADRVKAAVYKAVETIGRIQSEGHPFKVHLSLFANYHKPTDPGVFSDPPPGI